MVKKTYTKFLCLSLVCFLLFAMAFAMPIQAGTIVAEANGSLVRVTIALNYTYGDNFCAKNAIKDNFQSPWNAKPKGLKNALKNEIEHAIRKASGNYDIHVTDFQADFTIDDDHSMFSEKISFDVDGCVKDNGTHITYDLSWRKFNCDTKITVSDGQHDYDLVPGKIFALNFNVFKLPLTDWNKEAGNGKTTLSISKSYSLEDWDLDVDPTMSLTVPSANVTISKDSIIAQKSTPVSITTPWNLGITATQWLWIIGGLALAFIVVLVIKKPHRPSPIDHL
jgi:hypothetical protein